MISAGQHFVKDVFTDYFPFCISDSVFDLMLLLNGVLYLSLLPPPQLRAPTYFLEAAVPIDWIRDNDI